MPQTPTQPSQPVQDETQYAKAAKRHYDDAIHLHSIKRLANADYHFGFAVECALKSLLMRYAGASLSPKPNGRAAKAPWILDASGTVKELSHLPTLWTAVALHLQGRQGGRLSAVLLANNPFANWSVDHRYLDGTAVTENDVSGHRTAAEQILRLHDHALIAGAL
ncbi:hypothetical protein [Kitasatospora sp. SolWspMP-SS2h]|uniref:hypothetical protein n=1 Tax=Kitasatospora sp. SolWspMP-SS2h TaxID=1305729 RepID=UPI000DB8FEB0|nr:hypothetical protein [Kitasatospora sp. SolWspMP-SS2h]